MWHDIKYKESLLKFDNININKYKCQIHIIIHTFNTSFLKGESKKQSLCKEDEKKFLQNPTYKWNLHWLCK